jgi:hypothetical protein
VPKETIYKRELLNEIERIKNMIEESDKLEPYTDLFNMIKKIV